MGNVVVQKITEGNLSHSEPSASPLRKNVPRIPLERAVYLLDAPQECTLEEFFDSFVGENETTEAPALDNNVTPLLNKNEADRVELTDYHLTQAYTYVGQRDYPRALVEFRQAIKLNPDSAAVPYILGEIGILLKQMGAYDEAIVQFSLGKNLSAALGNKSLELEFVENIAYLRILKNILVETNTGPVPFIQIPEAVKQRIDADFAAWKAEN